jgi:hypothetical protein
MNQRMTVAVAVAGGYLLGRTKKGKKAIKVALWLAGKNRTALVQAGLSRVGGLPGAQDILDQVRGPLVEAARQVAISTFENRVGNLSEALRERTRSLSAGDSGDEDRPAEGNQAADDDATAPAREKRKPAGRNASTADRSGSSKSTTAAGRTSNRSAGKSAAQAKTSGAAKSSTSGKGTASKRSASNEADRSAPESRKSTGSRSGGTRSRTTSQSSPRSSTSKRASR